MSPDATTSNPADLTAPGGPKTGHERNCMHLLLASACRAEDVVGNSVEWSTNIVPEACGVVKS